MEEKVSDYKHALDESAIVAITDQKGIITHVNSNFCKISKYTADELIGKDRRIINSGYHKEEYIRELWKTIANGKVWKGELRNKAKDGTIYWVDTTIVSFDNGLDALDFLSNNKNNAPVLPEIILLDLSMPVMDGWQFLEEFTKLNQKIKRDITVYICSSSISPSDISRARSINEVSDFIIKPVTKDILIEMIEKL